MTGKPSKEACASPLDSVRTYLWIGPRRYRWERENRPMNRRRDRTIRRERCSFEFDALAFHPFHLNDNETVHVTLDLRVHTQLMRTELTNGGHEPNPGRQGHRFRKIEIVEGEHGKIEHQQKKSEKGHEIRCKPTWKELNRNQRHWSLTSLSLDYLSTSSRPFSAIHHSC